MKKILAILMVAVLSVGCTVDTAQPEPNTDISSSSEAQQSHATSSDSKEHALSSAVESSSSEEAPASSSSEPESEAVTPPSSTTESQETSSSTQTPSVASSSSSQVATPEPIQKTLIMAMAVSTEELSAYEPYNSYLDSAITSYPVNVVFTTNNPVSNFSFVSGMMQSNDVNMWFEVQSILFTPGEFSPEMKFVATTEFVGALPTRAIMFEDENGVTKVFSINQGGMAGGVTLVEEDYTIVS